MFAPPDYYYGPSTSWSEEWSKQHSIRRQEKREAGKRMRNKGIKRNFLSDWTNYIEGEDQDVDYDLYGPGPSEEGNENDTSNISFRENFDRVVGDGDDDDNNDDHNGPSSMP